MEVLHCPDNIKIHYAGAEVQNLFVAVRELGVNYALYTAFPFVERMLFGNKAKSPVIPLKSMSDPKIDIPRACTSTMKHCIQDSGLFTLMFGAQAGNHDEETINRWYDALCEFTLMHGSGATCVEVDCQKVLGVEKAWEFRERMRHDLPNRIINVFHLEDGQKGLDRMIEFSDYIAVSVPELRHAGKKDYTYKVASYIKNRKPEIDIHLLGCTEMSLLKQCASFCTSSDSTTYVSGKRYGFVGKHHIRNIRTEDVRKLVGDEIYDCINQYNNEQNTNFLCLSIESYKRKYQNAVGNQDYSRIIVNNNKNNNILPNEKDE